MATRRKSNSENGEITFEQAVADLEETVRLLEVGQMPIAESTALYEKGMKLSRMCSEMLASTELRITQIQTEYGEQTRQLQTEDSLDN